MEKIEKVLITSNLIPKDVFHCTKESFETFKLVLDIGHLQVELDMD
jgi:hypothetical protein